MAEVEYSWPEQADTQLIGKRVSRLDGMEKSSGTAKYTYELPPMVIWNQVELKVNLKAICDDFSIYGDMEIDNGNGWSILGKRASSRNGRSRASAYCRI